MISWVFCSEGWPFPAPHLRDGIPDSSPGTKTLHKPESPAQWIQCWDGRGLFLDMAVPGIMGKPGQASCDKCSAAVSRGSAGRPATVHPAPGDGRRWTRKVPSATRLAGGGLSAGTSSRAVGVLPGEQCSR